MSRIIGPSGKPVLSLHTQSEDGDLKLRQIFLNEYSADDLDRKNRIGLYPIYKFEDGGVLESVSLSSQNATIGIDMEIHKDKCSALYDDANDVEACLYGNNTGNTEGVTWTCSGCNATNFDDALRIVSIPPGKAVCETSPNKWEIRDQCGNGETAKTAEDMKSNVFRYVPQGGDQPLSNCTLVANTDDTYDCDYPLPGGYVVRVQLTTSDETLLSNIPEQPLSFDLTNSIRSGPLLGDASAFNKKRDFDVSKVVEIPILGASAFNQRQTFDVSSVTSSMLPAFDTNAFDVPNILDLFENVKA